VNVGPLEIALVLLIVLVIFGPKRLPQLGRSLGSGMREFKDGITGRHKDDDDDRDQLESGSASVEEVARSSSADDAQRAKAKATDAS
jgi:sec-independent protein translocase protein TatA